MSHAKRNTSLAFFTAHERNQLKSQWGSQTAQLNRDSFLPFGSCSLCLMPAQDPVACPGGPRKTPASKESTKHTAKDDMLKGVCHVFCRECILNNLLAQRQEIKRQTRVAEAQEREREEVDAINDEEAQRRALEEFEAVQMGLERKLRGGSKSGDVGQTEITTTRKIVGRSDGKVTVEEQSGDGAKKRKFELDEAELKRIANEDRSKARKLLDQEKEAAKKQLPAFWLPSQAPEAETSSKQKSKEAKEAKPVCPASTKSTQHVIALKTLGEVKWKQGENKSNEQEKPLTCPACSRGLTNASKAVLARPCGHVLCMSCVHKFVLNDDESDPHANLHPDSKAHTKQIQCFVCEEPLNDTASKKADSKKEKKDRDKSRSGLFEISTEGTGFSGAGGNLIKKEGVAFQFG